MQVNENLSISIQQSISPLARCKIVAVDGGLKMYVWHRDYPLLSVVVCSIGFGVFVDYETLRPIALDMFINASALAVQHDEGGAS